MRLSKEDEAKARSNCKYGAGVCVCVSRCPRVMGDVVYTVTTNYVPDAEAVGGWSYKTEVWVTDNPGRNTYGVRIADATKYGHAKTVGFLVSHSYWSDREIDKENEND